jgi:hypothetical protein
MQRPKIPDELTHHFDQEGKNLFVVNRGLRETACCIMAVAQVVVP